jgi:alkane 1-monooxygenase
MPKLFYLFSLTVPASVLVSLRLDGVWSYFALLYGFALIPLLELVLPTPTQNYSPEEEKKRLNDFFYDLLLYSSVVFQLLLLWQFMLAMQAPLPWFDRLGKILAFGLSCGVLGINAAHEIGHRNSWHAIWSARLLLSTSLYGHFQIEHNQGHHRHVSTPLDPASARTGENVYAFIVRSMLGSFRSAWEIEKKRQQKNQRPVFHPDNQLLQILLLQLVLVVFLASVFGITLLGYFIVAAFLGGAFLEVVNYIEHYGLSRRQLENGRYEKVEPHHSWNSNHLLGRAILFDLSRHSDHHANVGRRYQVLRHFEESPQLPTGYPGMMVLSLLPPLWFRLMNPRAAQTMKVAQN